MRQFLFAAIAVVLTSTSVVTADDPNSAAPPQPQPGQPQPGQTQTVPSARILQLEEELEALEAHRDVRKAYVKAAEVHVEATKNRYDLVSRVGLAATSTEVTTAKFELDMAKAVLEIRQAELKEAEVRVKYAKKRLDDAKASGQPKANPGGKVEK